MRRAAGCSAGTERSSRRRHLRRARVGMREDKARQPEGQRRLPDPALAGKDPAVVHAPGPVGVEKRVLGRRDGRRGSSSRAAASRLRARRAAGVPPRSLARAPCVSPLAGRERAERATAVADRLRDDRLGRRVASMTTQRSGSRAAMSRNTCRRASCSADRVPLEAVGRRACALASAPARLGRQVEDQRQVRPVGAHDDLVEQVEQCPDRRRRRPDRRAWNP